MKKLTLFIAACSMAIMSYAAGGNITYELNGGVTNDYGWKSKADMLVGLNEDYNTHYSVATTATWYTWETLDVIVGTGDPVTRIPTFATNMWGVITTAKWQWLHDYIVTICAEQSVAAIAEAENAYWRYNVSAFFISGKRATWPASADYAVAGTTEAFMPAWKHAFAGPATYDGSADVIIPDPYKEGFTFDGWYDNAAFTGEKVTSIAAGAEGDKTLFAKWVEYVPTCAEVIDMAAGTATKAGGIVTFVNGTTAYIQDASAGLMIEFSEAPAIAAGDKVTVTGTTAAAGSYVKVSGAALSSKETSSVPASQTITLAALSTDAASYMFEYVYFEGLKITAYNSGAATLSDGINEIVLTTALNQTEFPVNTKVNVKAVVAYNGAVVLTGAASGITKAPTAGVDGSVYAPQGDNKYTLTNSWLISNNLDNLSANPVGSAQMVRGMTALNGKMYFVDREHKQLTVVDGSTGEMLAPIALASNIFMHDFKDMNGNDSITAVAGTLPFNDIKQDAQHNILLGNCITSGAQPFQIWKIDLATGTGTLIIDEILSKNPDFKETAIRFDAFGVYGDIDGDAIVMAANASGMNVFKWTITDGVADPAEMIEIDTSIEGTFLTALTNPGTAPQIFPMDENYFYLDGNATLPTLIDMDGNIVDGFYNVPVEVEDWATGISSKQGHNGLIEFEMAGEYFFLMASTNTVGTPPSAFRLFKWKDANKEFKDIESLWTLPASGMGAASNPYRTAVPSVEVDENSKTASLYLYTGENGYGVYQFKINDANGINDVNNNNLKISVDNKTLKMVEEVANVSVYSVAGQLVVKAARTSSITVPSNGVFLVKATTLTGETLVQKVIVK